MSDGDDDDLDRIPAIAIGGGGCGGHKLGGTPSSLSRKSAEASASFASDDDDLDYIPPISGWRRQLSQDQEGQDPPHPLPPPALTDYDEPDYRTEISDSDSDGLAAAALTAAAAAAKDALADLKLEVRTVPHPSGSGLRVVMTDASSDDEVRAAWKQRREERRTAKGSGHDKGRKSHKGKMKRAGGAPADPSSKRPKLAGLTTTRTETRARTQPQPQKWQFSEDEDGEGAGAARNEERRLPAYLQGRKEWLQRAKKGVRKAADAEAVFRVPPSYEDVDFSDDERLEHLQSKPKFDDPPSAPYADIRLEDSLGVIPCSIAQFLRSYQVDGVRFLHRNFVHQEGCILGDDMGLGKTVQVIAFLTAAFGKTGDERDAKRMRKMRQFRQRAGEHRWYPKVLVVCPSSLIRNWVSELQTWGWWTVYVYHGSKDDKEVALRAATKGSLEIMITNYETYRVRHADVNMVEWDCVIADECHKIKGNSSEITKRMNEINALCRIGLTGTAIQNNYQELWTLLDWCRPGSIGTRAEWECKIAHPLRVGQRHDATWAEIGRARKVASMLVRNLLPRMFLRRVKSLIAHQLPKKTDKVVFCPLTETQREAYEAYLDSPIVHLIRDGGDPCPCGSGRKRRICCHRTDSEGRRINELVFPAILWIQKLANHLANWIPENSDLADARAQKLDLLQMCLPDRCHELATRGRLYNYTDPQMCGKWLVLQRLLQFWHQNGDKVLIFSYSLHLLHILRSLFRRTEYNVCYLDGQMPLADRAQAVDDFNHDPDRFVFLISTKAGGVGLNITAANKVVIFDPNWNPSYDLQAQDRAYRIGQTRDVEVFRLVSAGTIEEIVYARQIYKQQQANIGYDASEERRYFTGVMGDRQNKGELFGLRNLFSFHDNTILQEIVNKTNVAERRAGVLVADMQIGSHDDDDGVEQLDEDADDGDGDGDGDDDGDDGGGDGDGEGDDDDADGEEEGEGEDQEQDGGVLYALSQFAEDDLPISAMTKTKGRGRGKGKGKGEGKGKEEEKRRKRKTAPAPGESAVAAILAEAGVSYTHENSEVIGSSKVEAQISKRAVESTEGDASAAGGAGAGQQKAFDDQGHDDLEYRFHPPLDVRKRQFVTAAKTFGFADPLQFALAVEGLTQKQRRNVLERFYQMRIDGKERIDDHATSNGPADGVGGDGHGHGHGHGHGDAETQLLREVEEVIRPAKAKLELEIHSETWKIADLSSGDDEL